MIRNQPPVNLTHWEEELLFKSIIESKETKWSKSAGAGENEGAGKSDGYSHGTVESLRNKGSALYSSTVTK